MKDLRRDGSKRKRAYMGKKHEYIGKKSKIKGILINSLTDKSKVLSTVHHQEKVLHQFSCWCNLDRTIKVIWSKSHVKFHMNPKLFSASFIYIKFNIIYILKYIKNNNNLTILIFKIFKIRNK